METTILTSCSAGELKALLRELLVEILGEVLPGQIKKSVPDLLDVAQAADFLCLKVATLYDKTHKRLIPHIKKGNKLYFEKAELEKWLKSGKVETTEQIRRMADEHDFKRNNPKRA